MELDKEGMLPCKYCGSTRAYMEHDDLGWFGKCEQCEYESCYSDTREEALADWNRREHRTKEDTMKDIPDKDMAMITDSIESRITEALTPLYNQLAEQYGFDHAEADEMYDMGISTGLLPTMREAAVHLFEQLGMNVQGDGKGF